MLSSDKTWVNILILGIITVVLALAIRTQKRASIAQVNVNIESISSGKYLITEKEVLYLFRQRIGFDLDRSVIGELDIMGLEQFLEQDERIEDCEIYVDKRYNIHIDIDQRVPVLRIEPADGRSYYLDAKGNHIKTRLHASIRVPVATGYIQQYRDDFMDLERHNLKDLLAVANHINQDDFLEALVEQIDIKESGEIQIIPKMGRQRILIGSVENMEDKFYNLKVYYKKVVSKQGLDRFPELNLKYEGRIFGISEES